MIHNMFRRLISACAAGVLILSGCAWQGDFNELKGRVDDQEKRLSSLEEQVRNLNSQVALIQNLVSGKYYIESVTQISDGSGYVMVVVDQNGNTSTRTILNGKNGQNGKDGMTPSIAPAPDGYYYWTLNGSWILINGEKVRASGFDGKDGVDGKDGQDGKDGKDGEDGKDGADGLTPEFKIENGKWYVRLGEGEWTLAGNATEQVLSLISSIDFESDDEVVFIRLADGTTLEIPKGGSAIKLQLVFDDAPFAKITGGVPVAVTYQVKAASGITYELSSYEPEGWAVLIAPGADKSGTITITAPDGATYGKVMFVLNGSDGSCFVKVLQIGVLELTSYAVDESAHEITLSGVTNIQIPEEAGWITLQGSTLVLAENTDYDPRTAIVTYTDGEGITRHATITQAQKDALILPASGFSATAEGCTLEFILRANGIPETSSDCDWLKAAPATRGLSDLPYSIVVEPNPTASLRKGVVTFRFGSVSQSITVSQKGIGATGSTEFPIINKNDFGAYLSDGERLYESGTDQILRTYDSKNVLSFVILNQAKDQLVISGAKSSMQLGESATIKASYREGGKNKYSASHKMILVKVQGSTLWFSDTEGNGVIIKK